jgi:hypothetical protein
MTSPQQSDTDRIIAAQEEQGHRTRVLLVWLLVGVPVLGLLIWALIAFAAAGGARSATPPAVAPVPASTQIADFAVTDDTPCSAVVDFFGDSPTGRPVDPDDAAIYGGSDKVQADPFQTYLNTEGAPLSEENRVLDACKANDGVNAPDETVGEAAGLS